MKSGNKLLLFDMDGTLIYSKDAIFQAINLSLEGEGFEPFTEEELIRDIRIPLSEKYRKRAGTDPAFLMRRFREEYLRIFRESTYVHDGIVPVLRALKDEEIVCAIVTLKSGEEAEVVLDDTGLVQFFQGIFGSEVPHYRPKPSPEHVLFALAHFGVESENCAMVGDMRSDVVAAKRAGVTAIGVAWSLWSEEKLYGYGADHVAKDPEELERILRSKGFL